MASLPATKKLTPEEYLAIERKAEWKSEYLNGEMFAMSGVSFEHSSINMNLSVCLHGPLRSRGCSALASDMRVLVSATGLYTYPDFSIICGEPRFADKEVDTLLNPLVVIEILSPSTEAYDRGKKFGHYQAVPSIEQYVLVSQDEPRVDWYIRQANGQWLFSSATDLAGSLAIPSLDIRAPLSEIYDRVFPAVVSVKM